MKCRYKIIKCLYVFSLIFVVLGIFLLVGTQTSKDNYMDDINSNTCLAYCKADFSTWDQINDLCCNSRLTQCYTKMQCYDDYTTRFTRGIVLGWFLIVACSLYIIGYTYYRCRVFNKAIEAEGQQKKEAESLVDFLNS